jgi:tetratricopeptide (TPR) repeat protein
MRIKYLIFLFTFCAFIGCENKTKEQLAEEATNIWLHAEATNEDIHDKNESARYRAIRLYKEAIDKEDNDYIFDAKMYSEIAYQYWCLEKDTEAVNSYLIAAKLSKEIENTEEFNEYLGASYYRLKNCKNAINYLEKAININPKSWYSYSVLASIYNELRDSKKANKYKALEETYYPRSSGSTNFSSSSNPQAEFINWLYSNTAVTEVSFESDWQIWVTLQPYKYTSKSDVEEIATTIAGWYAQKTNKSLVICTVWRGDKVYAKGSYSR